MIRRKYSRVQQTTGALHLPLVNQVTASQRRIIRRNQLPQPLCLRQTFKSRRHRDHMSRPHVCLTPATPTQMTYRVRYPNLLLPTCSPASKLLYNCTANAAVKVLQFMSILQPSLYHLFIHLHSVAAAFIMVPVACQYGFF